MSAGFRSPFGPNFRDFHAEELAEALTVLAEPTRLRILSLLNEHGELNIAQIVAKLGTHAQPTVTHHVAKLVNAGLVVKDKRGAFQWCTLAPRAVAEVALALHPWQSR
jgi:ArsR family transcriptional regulator, arsenate/arsenite/antimonite-responsive transcriptional repressor